MKLIKINNEYYLLNDDKIGENGWVIDRNGYILQIYDFEGDFASIKNDVGSIRISTCRKIIASTQKLDGLPLLDNTQILRLLGIAEDVEKLAEEYSENLAYETSQKQGFRAGYQRAKQYYENKKFTLEDMKKMYSAGQDDCGEFGNVRGFDSMFTEIIQEQTEWDAEIEMEVPVQVRDVLKPVVRIPKLTNGNINIISLK